MTTSENVLLDLRLSPADVPALPARVRSSLIDFLLRWEHYDAALRCGQQLMATHSHLVSILDAVVQAHLGLGQPHHALEVVRARHAIKTSSSSRVLEARAHLAAGDQAAARAIAHDLVAGQPDLLLTWVLQSELCLATGDLEGAEAALKQHETLRPEASATAVGLARIWQARGDADKALLWARTALARTERDQRQPSVELLRLLVTLYRDTGQMAQAEAITQRLQERRHRDIEELRQALQAEKPGAETRPEPSPRPAPKPRQATAVENRGAPAASSTRPLNPVRPRADTPRSEIHQDVLTGSVTLTLAEQARLDEALRLHFPHDCFRPGQADVMASILRGESVLAVMPTGGGKSLCYQLAALLLPGTTLVISPLIALMKDQLDGLPPSVAAQATTLNSTLDGTELDTRLARAAAGGFKLLYAAPERLRQRPFLHALKRAAVSLLVVDEAHCVSLWGHDFRPDYQFIAKAWHELGKPPILAMTATATPRVRDDIQAALGQVRLIATDVQRPNLRLETRRFAKDREKQGALLDLCREIDGSGIVYANARHKCEELADLLRTNGLSAIPYHARVTDRTLAQDRFMTDEARIVVATIAFGMGVDKADIRFIIHYDPPGTLEDYYQQAGRAGRDGLPSRCILFHTPADKAKWSHRIHDQALDVEFLRSVYAAVQARLGEKRAGLIALADLERDLIADDTKIRVAVHFLETAGLLERGFDLPRTAALTLRSVPDDADPAWARFVEAAHLRIHQTVSRDLLAASADAGLDPHIIEAQVLAWDEAGRLRYRGIGRDMWLVLPPPPPDSRQRVAAMVADYRAGQEGRIAEIMSYARTHRCRHGYISTYFGGRRIERCEACDNCLGIRQSYSPAARISAGDARPRKALPRLRTEPDDYDETLFQELRAWRLKKAQEFARPPYTILQDSTLKEIAANRPATRDELLAIRGIGPRKMEQFGSEVLEIVAGQV